MARDIPLSNGCLFLSFDLDYQMREVTYPFIGLENHTEGHPLRFGFFTMEGWTGSQNQPGT